MLLQREMERWREILASLSYLLYEPEEPVQDGVASGVNEIYKEFLTSSGHKKNRNC